MMTAPRMIDHDGVQYRIEHARRLGIPIPDEDESKAQKRPAHDKAQRGPERNKASKPKRGKGGGGNGNNDTPAAR